MQALLTSRFFLAFSGLLSIFSACFHLSCGCTALSKVSRHTNSLIHEASPYLLQHAHNPVDWMPWSETAFEKARAEGKPVFLSVGYSSCHWCHVMERESFEDDRIAEYLNAHFISVKVDREERPDIDHHYMQAVHSMSGRGGWPMSVFLTSDKKPFYAGTYWPPRAMLGRPGFPDVLQSVVRAWQDNRPEILSSADEIHVALRESVVLGGSSGEISKQLLEGALKSASERFDSIHGGFGQAPKFPHAMELSLLLRIAARTGSEEALRVAEYSLRKMAAGGIYDHLGGGFHRYSTDVRWLVPHFEKMLYDNALLVPCYMDAWRLTGDDEFLNVATGTLDWAIREMEIAEGGFSSSLDADSEGEEGKYYAWSRAEINAALEPRLAELFIRVYDVSETGNFEHGKSVLNLPLTYSEWSRRLDISVDTLTALLSDARAQLLNSRELRIRPARDDKVLADWNGLIISALARGYEATGDEQYLRSAQRAADRVLTHFERTGIMPHSMLGERVQESQLLLDFAAFSGGLLDLFQCDGDARWLNGSVTLARMLDSVFSTGTGLYKLAAEGVGDAIPVDPYDNALPSGIALAGNLHARLFYMTGDEWYRERALDQVNRLADFMARAPAAFSQSMVTVDLLLNPPTQVVLIGDRDHILWSALQRHRRSECLVVWVPEFSKSTSEGLSPIQKLLDGKAAIAGAPTAYLCRDFVCDLPVTKPSELVASLTQPETAESRP